MHKYIRFFFIFLYIIRVSMKKLALIFLIVSSLITRIPKAYAIEDPLKTQNNIFGVHILFPSEITDAAKIINSNGGDWGYVIIPVQSGDKNIFKWQEFMNHAKELHVIPILRLASE